MNKKRKKAKKKPSQTSIKYFRFLVTASILVLTFFFYQNQALEPILLDEPPVLYSSICEDNLEKLFVEGVQQAKHSIVLIIYSLNDPHLIAALNQQAAKGISIQVLHDTTTPSSGFSQLVSAIELKRVKPTGLMHRKILIVDEINIWLGSANMTAESLKLHHNLVVGLSCPKLAQMIREDIPFASLSLGEQTIEYWSFPKKGDEGLQKIIGLIDSAQKSVRVAMFTWTHKELTAAVIRAHLRGVKVEVILDRGQAHAVCMQTLQALNRSGIDVRLSSGLGLLHHKLAWIDEEILINGSANWTVSAFKRNHDCCLILYHLTPSQNEKMRELWRRTQILFHSCYTTDSFSPFGCFLPHSTDLSLAVPLNA